MELIIDIMGWTGSAAVVIAYGLNSYQKIRSDSGVFLLLNFFGGLFLIVYSFYYRAYANTFINVVWVIIAIFAVLRLVRKK